MSKWTFVASGIPKNVRNILNSHHTLHRPKHCGLLTNNCLSHAGRQTITWTSDYLRTIRPSETNFSEIWISMQNRSFDKMHSSSAKWKSVCSHPKFLIHFCGFIWRHSFGSTLVEVMACCLTAPSHYLNQFSLIINKVQWYSSNGNFTKDTSAIHY